jgi:hypothetical protein
VPRKNTAFRLYFDMVKNDGSLITSWAGQDSEVSIDGATFTDCTNEATEIGASGIGYIDLTSSELNGDAVIVKVTVTNTGALVGRFYLYPEEAGDIRVDTVQISGDSAAADNLEADYDGTGYNKSASTIGTVTSATVTSIATDAITAASLAADAVAEIADGVWDEATSGHTTAGSTGAALTAAGAAGDPLTNAVPGSYAGGTAGYILGSLTGRALELVSPVLDNEDVEIVAGDDYKNADARSLDYTFTGYPSFTGGSCVMKVVHKSTFVTAATWSGTVQSATALRWELTSAQTNLNPGDYWYEIQVTLTGGNVTTPIALPNESSGRTGSKFTVRRQAA